MASCVCSLLAAFLLLGLSGTLVQACTDAFGALDCSTNYAETVANMTVTELLNLALFCQKIGDFKYCLSQACGGVDQIPQSFQNQLDKAWTQQKCDKQDSACADFSKIMNCLDDFTQAQNATPSAMQDFDLYCKMITDYKTCLTGACGSWERVPSAMVDSVNTALEQMDGFCAMAGHESCSSLLLVLCLSLALLFSRDHS